MVNKSLRNVLIASGIGAALVSGSYLWWNLPALRGPAIVKPLPTAVLSPELAAHYESLAKINEYYLEETKKRLVPIRVRIEETFEKYIRGVDPKIRSTTTTGLGLLFEEGVFGTSVYTRHREALGRGEVKPSLVDFVDSMEKEQIKQLKGLLTDINRINVFPWKKEGNEEKVQEIEEEISQLIKNIETGKLRYSEIHPTPSFAEKVDKPKD
ncbi:hypothetical protein HYV88_04330 [Candidatus Woesearchaeota archaeon]|nr:hypothetical protein [Candidatus Woesearchaeota archaeon]